MNLVTRRRVGNAIWGAGVVVALIWGGMRNVRYEARGIGFAAPVLVSSLETGRLQALDVELHDTVNASQVLARIDPGLLEAERDVISAELLAVQAEQAADAANNARRFAEGVEGSMVDSAKLRAALEEDRALAASLNERIGIERGLASTGASSTQQVRQLERELEVVQARMAASQSAWAAASKASSNAQERSDGLPVTNEWNVVAAARTLDLVEKRIARLQLSAGIEGQVTAIFRNPGEVVASGEPVLQVTQTGTDEVLAWLPSAAAGSVLGGRKAHVVRSTGEVLAGQLISVGSGPQQIPAMLWTNPASPEWGLPVRIHLSGAQVGAQEAVTVRI